MRWRGPRVSPARRLTPELGERSVDARNQRGDFSGFDFVMPEMTGDDPRDVMPIGLDVVSHAFLPGMRLLLEHIQRARMACRELLAWGRGDQLEAATLIGRMAANKRFSRRSRERG
jgi:hypothetical protein